jgi:hypothetical protein
MNVLKAHPDRIVSLIDVDIPTNEEYEFLSEYLRCSQSYLYRLQEYIPQNFINNDNTKAKDMIYEILDSCAGVADSKILQKQISRIVKHNMETIRGKETTKKLLLSIGLVSAKVNALYDVSDTDNYGFNFSDFMRIKRASGLTSDELLTGKKR